MQRGQQPRERARCHRAQIGSDHRPRFMAKHGGAFSLAAWVQRCRATRECALRPEGRRLRRKMPSGRMRNAETMQARGAKTTIGARTRPVGTLTLQHAICMPAGCPRVGSLLLRDTDMDTSRVQELAAPARSARRAAVRARPWPIGVAPLPAGRVRAPQSDAR